MRRIVSKRAILLRNLLVLFIVLCNIGCDQVSKNIVRNSVSYHENISLISRRLILTKVENSGAFLSLGDSLPNSVKFVLLSLLPALVLAFGLYTVLTRIRMPKPLVIGICCILGGGIGNLFDRIRYGSVTDFLHLDFGLFRTGIFNLADVSIMIGTGILIASSIYHESTKKRIVSE